MNIAAIALLAIAPTNELTVEYVPLDQVPHWYATAPYMHTGVCMITEQDITCATNTQRKHTTFHDRYTQALYKLIQAENQSPTPKTTL